MGILRKYEEISQKQAIQPKPQTDHLYSLLSLSIRERLYNPTILLLKYDKKRGENDPPKQQTNRPQLGKDYLYDV